MHIKSIFRFCGTKPKNEFLLSSSKTTQYLYNNVNYSTNKGWEQLFWLKNNSD